MRAAQRRGRALPAFALAALAVLAAWAAPAAHASEDDDGAAAAAATAAGGTPLGIQTSTSAPPPGAPAVEGSDAAAKALGASLRECSAYWLSCELAGGTPGAERYQAVNADAYGKLVRRTQCDWLCTTGMIKQDCTAAAGRLPGNQEDTPYVQCDGDTTAIAAFGATCRVVRFGSVPARRAAALPAASVERRPKRGGGGTPPRGPPAQTLRRACRVVSGGPSSQARARNTPKTCRAGGSNGARHLRQQHRL